MQSELNSSSNSILNVIQVPRGSKDQLRLKPTQLICPSSASPPLASPVKIFGQEFYPVGERPTLTTLFRCTSTPPVPNALFLEEDDTVVE